MVSEKLEIDGYIELLLLKDDFVVIIPNGPGKSLKKSIVKVEAVKSTTMKASKHQKMREYLEGRQKLDSTCWPHCTAMS